MEGPDPGAAARRTPTVGVFADVLAASNDAILYARDRDRLLEEVCRIAVEVGGLRMAWAGLADAAGDEVRVAAHFGVSAEYLERIHIALSGADPEGRGPTGTAVREGRSMVCQDFETDPHVLPWREAARAAGFRSSAAVALRVGSQVIGALTVYAPEANRFGDEVVEQLEELARDVAFALRALDAIEQARRSEADARHRQHELEALFRAMTEAVVVLDPELRIVDCNRAFVALVGEARSALVGIGPPWPGWSERDGPLFERIRGALSDGGFTTRATLPRGDGSSCTADLTVTPIEEEDRPLLVCTIHDVTKLEEARHKAEAARDYLEAAAGAMVEGMFAVDPEGIITYANEAAADMLGWTRDELVGRNGHDTFHGRRPDGRPYPPEECAMASCVRTGEATEGVRETYLRRDGSAVTVIASAAPFTTERGESGTIVLFEDAEKVLADEVRIERELSELSWVGRVRDALAEDRLVLYAQPIVDAATGETVQRELLLRLRLPDGTIVPPGQFLPAAEKYGLMTEIDRWVAIQAVTLAARGTAVEFNLSAASIADVGVIGSFEDGVRAAGVDPSLIVVEVTETGLVEAGTPARHALERLKRLGCRLAIDDFGTGYGGLTYVKKFPIDILKIDVEFVRDAVANRESEAVVRAVVALAAGLGLETVAEGVEDAGILALMRDLGVTHLQGYHLGRPAPIEELG